MTVIPSLTNAPHPPRPFPLSRRTLLRVLTLTGAVAAVPGLAGCGAKAGAEGAALSDVAMSTVARLPASPAARRDGVRAISSFTGALFAAVAAKPGNVVCSPYSVAVALGMTRNGARGQTATEMDTVLNAPSLDALNAGLNSVSQLMLTRSGEKTKADGNTAQVALEVANTVFGQHDTMWEQPFLDSLASSYGAGVRLVDYEGATEAARTRINAWTKANTGDAIPEIIAPDDIDGRTRMVLVNAVHLKAPWALPFEEGGTQPGPFRRADGTSVQAEMMHLLNTSGEVAHGPGWTATRLLYAGGELGIALVLPDEGREGDVVKALGGSGLGTLLGSLHRSPLVDLTMPKFDFGYRAYLEQVLPALGMPTAFREGLADFSGMTTQEPLWIAHVLHQGRIAVDEQGTEASAATAVVMETDSAVVLPKDAVTLVLDRPFLFVIHDVETATPIFIGRVTDPTATD